MRWRRGKQIFSPPLRRTGVHNCQIMLGGFEAGNVATWFAIILSEIMASLWNSLVLLTLTQIY